MHLMDNTSKVAFNLPQQCVMIIGYNVKSIDIISIHYSAVLLNQTSLHPNPVV